MKIARVQDSSFVRDIDTNAILQTDMTLVRQHEERIKRLQKEQARDEEINNLRKDMEEIKGLLVELIKNKSAV